MPEIKYHYTRKGLTDSDWSVTQDGNEIAVITVKDDTIIATPKNCEFSEEALNAWLTDVEQGFMDFVNRPEFVVGKLIPWELLSEGDISPEQQQELIEYCNQYIRGCCYAMYSEDLAEKYTQRALSWLEGTDFYVAPASTKYHDNVVSGLLRHTLKVVNNVIMLSTMPQFKDTDIAEATLAAIVHDWCKINFYEEYLRNVKNEDNGAWEKVLSYRCKESEYPFGHGVTSLFIAEKIFKLSVEQALAVRWHMDAHDLSDYESYDLYTAKAHYPMVLLLQMADQLALL